MSQSVTPGSLLPEHVLRNYIRAKDENRPHVLDRTFDADASVEIANRSAAIEFPAMTHGRVAIAKLLVRDFGKTYENIYTFYLDRPVGAPREFSCGWIVAMTEKATGSVRVGGGRYRWMFGDAAPHLASRLLITISAMTILPGAAMPRIYAWIERLPYPWTSAAEVLRSAPDLPEVQSVLSGLSDDEGGA